ncbi:MAG: GLPGLI family protein [Bacteroidetes bacterium]|nr:MAG: GLPGLI family protein [Bacteroidota bacterium]
MKTLFISLGALLFIGNSVAQNKGSIIYEVAFKIQLGPVEGLDSAMMSNLPRESKSHRILYFSPEASIYQNHQKESVDDLMEKKGNIVIKMDEMNDIIYTDLKAKKRTEQRDFMSRLFLIESEIQPFEWKPNGETRTIKGYNCLGAEIPGDSMNPPVKIWFAPSLQPAVGPMEFSGFPGAVLAAELDEGMTTIEAIEVNLDKDFTDQITKPKKGKKISPEKFMEIVDAKMKEMQEEYGGDGQTVIKIVHD